jgi:hypothetical protein
MRIGRKRRLGRRVALGFALIVVAAPTAQARTDEGQSAGGPSAIVRPDDRAVRGVPATASGQRLPMRADDKVLAPAPGVLVRGDDKVLEPTAGAEYSQFAYRRALPQDYGLPVQVVSLSRPGGFDWGDAGIGAGTLLGAMLLAAGFILAARHSSKPTAA